MQLRLRACPGMLGLLVSVACTDSPTAPLATPENARSGETGAYIPPEDGECVPWQDINWCQGRRTGECITSSSGTGAREVVGVQRCDGNGGGGGGGGSTAEPPPPPAADTCLTGDEALDDPAVKQGLKDLWSRSNPDAPQAQRLEQGGWVIQGANGSYSMAPFAVTAQGPCSINGNLNAPPGAVAWVHTHPFRTGEVQTICGAMKQADPRAPGGFRDVIGANGLPVYPVYDNKPSFPDRELMSDMNHTRSQLGQPLLAGLIIDYDQTTVYTENPADGATILPRCGY